MKKAISKLILRLMGWKVVGEIPKDMPKYIMVAAPHTSNWDFVIGSSFGYQLGIEAKFLGKSQLFKWPYGFLFRAMGGIPVDRTKHNSLVAFTVDLFNKCDELIIGLGPEGTRRRVERWKMGFYHIAVGANIPIVLAFMDYKRKEAGVGAIIHPSGDLEADMAKVEAFYQNITPKYPALFNQKIY